MQTALLTIIPMPPPYYITYHLLTRNYNAIAYVVHYTLTFGFGSSAASFVLTNVATLQLAACSEMTDIKPATLSSSTALLLTWSFLIRYCGEGLVGGGMGVSSSQTNVQTTLARSPLSYIQCSQYSNRQQYLIIESQFVQLISEPFFEVCGFLGHIPLLLLAILLSRGGCYIMSCGGVQTSPHDAHRGRPYGHYPF